MKRIIPGDEIWVKEYDCESSQQSSEWRAKNEPKLKKSSQSWSKIKVLFAMNSFRRAKWSIGVLLGRFEASKWSNFSEKAGFVGKQFMHFTPRSANVFARFGPL